MSTAVNRLLARAGRTLLSRRRKSRHTRQRTRLDWATVRLEDRVMLTTFIVTNTNDKGGGSLRAAINAVNADKGKPVDTIDFNIPGTGPFTISPLSALPAVTHAVLIDGYSQPQSSPNTRGHRR